ncbi:uncharacterized protein [Penaeus vannamei]|nr:uncharacterized protein LOC113817288 [Penaeus vannamei]
MRPTPNSWTKVLALLSQLLAIAFVSGHRKYKHFPGTYTWGFPESGPISFSGGASSSGGARSVGFGDFRGTVTFGNTRGRWVGRATPIFRAPSSKVVSSTIFVSSPGLPDNAVYNPYNSRRGGYGAQGGFRQRYPSGQVRGGAILYSNDGFYREVDPREIIYGRALQGALTGASQAIVTLNETDGAVVMVNPQVVSYANATKDSFRDESDKELLPLERLGVQRVADKTEAELARNKTDLESENTASKVSLNQEESTGTHEDFTDMSPMPDSTDNAKGAVSRQRREKDIRFVPKERTLTTVLTVTSGDTGHDATRVQGRSDNPDADEQPRNDEDLAPGLPELPTIDAFIHGALFLGAEEPGQAGEARMAADGTRGRAEVRWGADAEPKESSLRLSTRTSVESAGDFTDVPSEATSALDHEALTGLVLYFLLTFRALQL